MAIEKKITKNTNLSRSNDKRSELLIKVDNLMEKLDNEYGPFLLDELNKRLEQTIEKFNDDLKIVLDESFKKYNMKIKNVDSTSSNEEENSSVPTFIAKYEKKIENKNKK